MTDFEELPAWARRRLARRFERGASERIVRWMSLPAGRGAGAVSTEATAPDNIVAFVPRPEAAPVYERPRVAAAG
ncbi:hypothetical protein ASG52_11330 [Methylobacterium sp. Leaf456]|uniref:hypothetical protein n=1 Tax=Methylobacterium sp. Leaf456 TaxID=1736382 RepID=UPI0006FFF2ED|nr:hypothetical protein [Methylobacterium sp. Leaf456]KQT47847.1 hypothetical protein ASG52_11330 [Methylobacterium sp. Leaf456]